MNEYDNGRVIWLANELQRLIKEKPTKQNIETIRFAAQNIFYECNELLPNGKQNRHA